MDGHGREAPIPADRQHGFHYWRVLECTHQYNNSRYYADDDPTPRYWQGYDLIAQTEDACRYIRDHAGQDKHFALFLSWGPPHNPYETAPARYRAMYDPAALILRDNVPADYEKKARSMLAGYYAHITAMDDCVAMLCAALQEAGVEEKTAFVLTSDHGDMVGSRRGWDKQRPYEESIRVPLLLRYPDRFGWQGPTRKRLVDAPDLMPTLLNLCGVEIPESVEGRDVLTTDEPDPETDAALLACYVPFATWSRAHGGREYRGLRTRRYTYARTLEGPWLLYDNQADPFQINNLCDDPAHAALQADLEAILQRKLADRKDAFCPAEQQAGAWGYILDEEGICISKGSYAKPMQ